MRSAAAFRGVSAGESNAPAIAPQPHIKNRTDTQENAPVREKVIAGGLKPSDVTGSDDSDLGQSPKASAAHPHATRPLPPDLQRLADAWPALPPAVRADILAMAGIAGEEVSSDELA